MCGWFVYLLPIHPREERVLLNVISARGATAQAVGDLAFEETFHERLGVVRKHLERVGGWEGGLIW